MIKKLLAAMLALFAAAAFAAVDVNKATQADLESIKGIGPVISGKILDERKKAPFKDWNDMVTRVKGVGEGNAAKFSADGMTVNGAAFAGAPAAAKQEAKSKMKSDAKTPAADAAKTTKTDSKATESTTAAPKDRKPTGTAAATDETRQKRAEERAAEGAIKAKEKAAKRAAEASAPVLAPAAASTPSKKK